MCPLPSAPRAKFLRPGSVALAALTLLLGAARPAHAAETELDAVEVSTDSELLPGERAPAAPGGRVARGTHFGILGQQDRLTTPASQQSYTLDRIRDQTASGLTGALSSESAVRSSAPPDAFFDNFLIRGFAVLHGEYALDGVFLITGPNRHLLAGVERIEVLRGASNLMFGMPPYGSIGGVINLIPKRAPDAGIRRVGLRFMPQGNLGAEFDVGQRFGPDHVWGVRINGFSRGGSAATASQQIGQGELAIGLDYRGERLRAALDTGYQRQGISRAGLAFYGLPEDLPIPDVPDGRLIYQQPWENFQAGHAWTLFKAELDLRDDLTLFGHMGGARVREATVFTQGAPISAAGDVELYQGNVETRGGQASLGLGLRGRLQTGAIRHQWVLAWDRAVVDQLVLDTVIDDAPVTNLYNPVTLPEPLWPARRDEDGQELTQRTRSVVLADVLTLFDGRLDLTLGLRHQQVQSRTWSRATESGDPLYRASRIAPSAAVLWRLTPQVSLYAHYNEALALGSQAPETAANAGSVTPPTRSRQIETGLKADYGNVGLQVALWRLARPSEGIDPRTQVYGITGMQRHRGLDLTVFGKPTPASNVLFGLTWMDPRLTRTEDGLADGRIAPAVPRVQANLDFAWEPRGLEGFTLSSQVQFTGAQYYDRMNTQRISPWTVVGLGASQRFTVGGHEYTARAWISNLLGRDYWQSAIRTLLTRGAPRTVHLGISGDF